MFAYNYKKYLPENDNEYVTISYIVSDVERGLVSSYSINKIKGEIKAYGFTTQNIDATKLIICYNEEKTFGAYSEEDLLLAKSKARNNFKTMGRYVTLNDYKTAVENRPYIIKSTVMDWNSTTGFVTSPYQVKAWIVTEDLEELPKTEIISMEEEIKNKGIS